MKQSIQWHEEGLKNFASTVEREREYAVRAIGAYKRTKAQYEFARLQLEIAKARRMDGYDSERFLKSRKP